MAFPRWVYISLVSNDPFVGDASRVTAEAPSASRSLAQSEDRERVVPQSVEAQDDFGEDEDKKEDDEGHVEGREEKDVEEDQETDEDEDEEDNGKCNKCN